VETDRAGRVRIQHDLTVPGHPEIFVVGDTAAFDQDGKPLPGVAQVAMQQGRYAGALIHRRLTHKAESRSFRYFDKGMMAVVGQGYAVLQSGAVHVKGLPAWLAWAGVHILFLGQTGPQDQRLPAMMWILAYRAARLAADCGSPRPRSGADDGQRADQTINRMTLPGFSYSHQTSVACDRLDDGVHAAGQLPAWQAQGETLAA